MSEIHWNDWIEKYEPIQDHPIEWDELDKSKDNWTDYTWTLVEGDETTEIAAGMHVVNRLGYFQTQKAHTYTEIVLDD